MSFKETLRTVLNSIAKGMSSTSTISEMTGIPVNFPNWQQRYSVVRELPGGASGRVLVAERRSDSLMVCLKFMSRDIHRRMAEQECRALLRLRHASIIPMVDFSFEDDPPWLATEFVEGCTLHTYMTNYTLQPQEIVVQILKRLLDGLSYAHEAGVIHRDLKPANIMIQVANGQISVRILDFGLAIVDEFDHEGVETAIGADPLGTLKYMAPEQLLSDLLTPACDVYAVGLIAWEMLMGRSIFADKTRAQIIFEKVNRKDGFLLDNPPIFIPETLSSLVTAFTVSEPRDRPTAREGLCMLVQREMEN